MSFAGRIENRKKPVTVKFDFEDPIRRINRRLRAFRHHRAEQTRGRVGFAMGSSSALQDTISRVGRQEDVAHGDPIPTSSIGGCIYFMRPMRTLNFENEISRVSVPRRTDRQDTRADRVGAGHGGL
jgi:hypothetical protein